jgi:glucosylglycerate synthase
MKVYVGIPSFNEAETIKTVVKNIDLGLQIVAKKNKNFSAKIINIDSDSDDNTSSLFRKTKTFFPKKSIILKKPRGKGKNIFSFFRTVKKEKADFCIIIDSDLRSINPLWIKKFLDPLLEDKADFVTPLYKRSRFEGSSTNHFAFPVLYATTGEKIRQPIAGDFAFNSYLLKKIKMNDSIKKYGIDIHLTLSAVINNFRIIEVPLGKKIHNKSFDKLEKMFPQIASALLFTLRENKISKRKPIDKSFHINNIISKISFTHKKEASQMRNRSFIKIKNMNYSALKWFPKEIEIKKDIVSSKDWTTILSSWIKYGLHNKKTSSFILSKQLLPFFALRATSFWFLSEKMTSVETEKEIINQSINLYKKLDFL